jgi:hypothetical protein
MHSRVAYGEEEELEDGFVVGEWSAIFQRFAQLRVERFHHVRRVQHSPELGRIGKKWDELFPSIAEGEVDPEIRTSS